MRKRAKKPICNKGNVFFSASEDIVFEILSWLPASSVLQFKTVCKSWYSLIHSQMFISQHLRRSHSLMEYDFLLLKGMQYACHRLQLHNLELSRQIDSPGLIPQDVPQDVFVHQMIVCNGLVCLERCHKLEQCKDYVLWNPALNQARLLPISPVFKLREIYATGFGYDASTDDYIIILLVTNNSGQLSNDQVCIYSLKADSWKTKQVVIPEKVKRISSFGGNSHPRIGVYSWCASSSTRQFEYRKNFILSYDFSKGVFETMSLPDACNDSPFYQFAIVKGYLACITEIYNRFEVWVLNKESWTRLCTLGPINKFRHCPKGLSEDGKYFLLADNNQCLYIYDTVARGTKNHRKFEDMHCPYVALYKESLISVKGGKMQPM